MKNKNTALALTALLAIFSARFVDAADGSGSHGGDAIVCEHPGSALTVELLDHHEAAERWDSPMDLGPQSLTVREKFNLVLERLARLDSLRAEAFRSRAEGLLADIEAHKPGANEKFPNTTFTKEELDYIADDDHKSLPRGCTLKQLIVRQTPQFAEDRIFTINGPYWDLMDRDNQAASLLHEIAYWEASDRGQHNSTKARYFNAKISSKAFETIKLNDYFALINTIKFHLIGFKGLLLDSLRFDSEGNLISAVTHGGSIKIGDFVYPVGDQDRPIQFAADGHVIRIYSTLMSGPALPDKVKFDSLPNTDRQFVFNDEGKLAGICRLSNNDHFEWQGADLRINNCLYFHPNRQLKAVLISDRKKLPDPSHSGLLISVDQLFFHENGTLGAVAKADEPIGRSDAIEGFDLSGDTYRLTLDDVFRSIELPSGSMLVVQLTYFGAHFLAGKDIAAETNQLCHQLGLKNAVSTSNLKYQRDFNGDIPKPPADWSFVSLDSQGHFVKTQFKSQGQILLSLVCEK